MTSPRATLELELTGMWQDILKLQGVGVHDHFETLGGTPALAHELAGRLSRRYGFTVLGNMLRQAPTIARMAAHLEQRAEARKSGFVFQPLTTEELAQTRRELEEEVLSGPPESEAPRCAPIAFVLSPRRSGSTLLRVMLAGHPDLFSPTEMALLYFSSMRQRAHMLAYVDFWGLERAISDVWQCDLEEAGKIVGGFVASDVSPQAVYRQMQQRLGPRLIVDKTPRYASSQMAMRRAERWFEAPRYIHLSRHPLAHIRSWERENFDQLISTSRCPRISGELMWTIPHQNILAILADVPAERQCRLKMEDLVADPRGQGSRLCDFLQVPFHPDVLRPYAGGRMTYAVQGRVSGDPRFTRHSNIDGTVLEGSRRLPDDGPLHAETITVAQQLGYTDL